MFVKLIPHVGCQLYLYFWASKTRALSVVGFPAFVEMVGKLTPSRGDAILIKLSLEIEYAHDGIVAESVIFFKPGFLKLTIAL